MKAQVRCLSHLCAILEQGGPIYHGTSRLNWNHLYNMTIAELKQLVASEQLLTSAHGGRVV